MYLEIISDSDQHTLQRSICKINDWSKTWQLKLANDKCQQNRISLSTALLSTDYFISDSELPTVSSVRDLGVIVDNRLTFRDHSNSIVSHGHVTARLGIDRLELRRLRADLILCYKIIHGLVLLPDHVIIF